METARSPPLRLSSITKSLTGAGGIGSHARSRISAAAGGEERMPSTKLSRAASVP